eukprot:CAMPEP_0180658256 /NCGR_PEP_ID=MMETSP1037_2-20121125/56900_1 /TAXON_ID=632150 /ORGANISM="Azadinium spinosum, Strain 3D9" /LENGTH=50 /DNA_ID=CAMNT_0022685117 /DNA_START=38 /DNA_END=186 /DNA_ORIENTATION=-
MMATSGLGETQEVIGAKYGKGTGQQVSGGVGHKHKLSDQRNWDWRLFVSG